MNFDNLFSLKGRTALITGGSRGIGRMIASGFIAQGARVYISGRKAAACEQAAHELDATGRCIPLPCDVSTVAGCEDLAAAYGKHEESLNILVNNAGAAWGDDFDAFPESGWDKVLDLNLKTPFFLTKALSASLRRAASQRTAKVINIASIDGVGLNPQENYSYVTSKAFRTVGGLRHLHRLLAPKKPVEVQVAPTLAKLALQRKRVRDRAHRHLSDKIRAGSGSWRDHQCLKLATERTRPVQQVSPELSRFPVAVIGDAVSKAEKDCQRKSDQRERNNRQGDFPDRAVGKCHCDGKREARTQLEQDSRQDGTAQREEKSKAVGPVADYHPSSHFN